MGVCCSAPDSQVTNIHPNNSRIKRPQIQRKIDYQEDFIKKYFKQNPNANVIVLFHLKEDARYLIQIIQQTYQIIKNVSGKTFIPSIISENPSNSFQEFMLIMKSLTGKEKFQLDSGIKINDQKLIQSFIYKTIQFESHTHQQREHETLQELQTFYRQDGLKIIGGFQDNDDYNLLHLLMYKSETNSKQKYSINVEIFDASYTLVKEYEEQINQASLQDLLLKAVISYFDYQQQVRHHILVYQEDSTQDHLYLVMEFPESLEQMVEESGDQTQEYQVKFCQLVESLERKQQMVIDFLINNSLTDSFIVISQ